MPKTLSELTRDAAELSTVEQLKLARILLELAENNRLPQEEVDAAWEMEIE